MGRGDPVDRASGGESIYEVTDWEPRSRLDRIALQIHAALRRGTKWLVVISAIAVTAAIVGISGLDLVLEPAVATLVALSVLPAVAIAAYVRYTDVTTPEPPGIILITFLLATVTAGFAALINTAAFVSIGGLVDVLGEQMALALVFFVVVGPVEESVKLLAVRLYAYPDPRFDAVIDGAIYGAVAGLGFATIENALYITTAVEAGGGIGASSEALVGGVTATRAIAGPGHVLYSAIAGYYLGLAKFNRDQAGPIVVKGLLLATFFHATYNVTVGAGAGFVAEALSLSSLAGLLVYVVAYQSLVGAVLYRKLARYRRAYTEHGAGDVPGSRTPELTEFDP